MTGESEVLGCRSRTDQFANNFTTFLGGLMGLKYNFFIKFHALSIWLLNKIERNVKIACPPWSS